MLPNQMNALKQIYLRGQSDFNLDLEGYTDKDHPRGHDYLGFYARVFEAYRKQPVRLLEIGVANGASMWLWREYFNMRPFEGVGIDCYHSWERSTQLQPELERDPNIKLHWGRNSRNKASYEDLGQFDIIIDDGDHSLEGQKRTFDSAWNTLKAGGIYIIEDLQSKELAAELGKHILDKYGKTSQVFFGSKYPQRSDDIIVWVEK
jgi:hypothetical protein